MTPTPPPAALAAQDSALQALQAEVLLHLEGRDEFFNDKKAILKRQIYVLTCGRVHRRD